MSVRYYSIHNLLSFSIRNDGSYLRNFLDTTRVQFENFEIDKETNTVDFSVEIGAFKPRSKGCKILDDNYHIRKDYLCLNDYRKYAKWRIEIENLETCPVVRIDPNLAGCITNPLNLTEFLIQYCLLQRGYSVIHAGGVAVDGHAVLLPGTSGGGKTTVALSLVERGYDYLGDNYIIIDHNEALSYLTPLNIFSYNRVPLIEKALDQRQKCSLNLRKLLYDATKGYIKIFKKVNPCDIFANQIVSHGQIDLLCFLEPNDKFNRNIEEPRRIGLEEAVKKLRFNMELEWLQFNRYIHSYGYLYPQSLFANFWDQYETMLMGNLSSGINIYSIGVPIRYGSDVIQRIVDCLEELRGRTNN